eukprot:g3920.t1
MLPGPPFVNFVMIFYRDKSVAPGVDKEFDIVWNKFLKGDDSEKVKKFKYKAQFVECPWIVTGAVATLGGERPCIIGTKLDLQFFQGRNYLEIDCDVASSVVAKLLAKTVVDVGGDTVVVDHGFMLEGHTPEELPERLLASVRYSYVNMHKSMVDLSGEEPRIFSYDNYQYLCEETGELKKVEAPDIADEEAVEEEDKGDGLFGLGIF